MAYVSDYDEFIIRDILSHVDCNIVYASDILSTLTQYLQLDLIGTGSEKLVYRLNNNLCLKVKYRTYSTSISDINYYNILPVELQGYFVPVIYETDLLQVMPLGDEILCHSHDDMVSVMSQLEWILNIISDNGYISEDVDCTDMRQFIILDNAFKICDYSRFK